MSDHTLPPKAYSAWMAESVIRRGGAIASADGDAGQWLRVGFFQMALLELMATRPGSQQESWLAHLKRGSDSVVNLLIDAKNNTTYSMDRLIVGPGLFFQYEKTQEAVYIDALDALRTSLRLQPQNCSGGYQYFTYPDVSYLDGMYMLVPFLLQYTKRRDALNITASNNDIIHQIDLLCEHCYDSQSGLLNHGWDAVKNYKWANPISGSSQYAWGRALGWYVMAMIIALEELEISHSSAEWQKLHNRFKKLALAIASKADPKSGCWWQMMAHPERPDNYIESSCSAMFVYALFKGVRLGYLDDSAPCIGASDNKECSYTARARKAYDYIVRKFVVRNDDGTLSYDGTVSVCSLNSPATYEYYVGQPITYDSDLGTAAFVLASLENELYLEGELAAAATGDKPRLESSLY